MAAGPMKTVEASRNGADCMICCDRRGIGQRKVSVPVVRLCVGDDGCARPRSESSVIGTARRLAAARVRGEQGFGFSEIWMKHVASMEGSLDA
ncbi:hypothetical protein C8Q76DRAFT_722241 [Earliella scabrosa]|nr:hypothetical protein C8Q76DRAFT_722241 [Earliella scabrosa]